MPLRDDFQRGDPLPHETINELVRASRPPDLRVGNGLDGRRGPNGQMQLTLTRGAGASVAIVTTAVTARSGATPGQGVVNLLCRDYTGNLADYDDGVAVYSFSSGSSGVAVGKYCFVVEDGSGDWWVISAEC